MVDHARRGIAHRYFELLLASALLVGACAGTRASAGPSKPAEAVSTSAAASCPVDRVTIGEARVLVDKYCVSCHSPTGSAGEDYDFRGDAAITARRPNIEAKLRLHIMPPPRAPQPTDAERATLRCWAKQ